MNMTDIKGDSPGAAAGTAAKCRFLRDASGNAAVEFALILPVLALILFGALKFSLALNRQVTLNQAVDAAARYVTVCRGGCASNTSSATSTATGAWWGTLYAMDSSAPLLAASTLNSTITITVTKSTGTVDGTCTSDSTCSASLTADGGGGHVTVSATYPCDLNVAGINFAKGCTMSAQTTAIIE